MFPSFNAEIFHLFQKSLFVPLRNELSEGTFGGHQYLLHTCRI